MTTWALMITAEDGRHCHVYATDKAAMAGLADQLGRAVEPLRGQSRGYTDDWGRRLYIEPRPHGWTEARERRVGVAYDRREMGLTLTAAQRNVLAQFERGAV